MDWFPTPDLLELAPLIGLYAETHYRFTWFPFSRYYRRQPEIIFDAPHRIQPDLPLPVTLLVKDADRFPVELESVTIHVELGSESFDHVITLNERVSTPLWYRVFDIDLTNVSPGRVKVDCLVTGISKRRKFTVRNDNHVGLSHAPLSVRKLAAALPSLPGWFAGELHCHTDFGPDHVEFGAPLEVYRQTAPALGLSWIALTDHSYNLDDYEDDYLRDDPELRKWQRFLNEVDQMNTLNGVVFIPGEELSCRSATGKNVHMLILGNQEFLPGSGDGAQYWPRWRSELSVKEALEQIAESAFAAAAHPFARIGFLEKLLVGRGEWLPSDLQYSRLDGWQLMNDVPNEEFSRGIEAWKREILQGRRINIFAGNDAHGNFNRFRQVQLPMVWMRENQSHLCGQVFSSVRLDSTPSVNRVIEALKSGKVTLSDGPALEMQVVEDEDVINSGGSVSEGEIRVRLKYKSSTDFGGIEEISLFGGSDSSETTLKTLTQSSGDLPDLYSGEIQIPANPRKYIRAELRTNAGNGRYHMALTNPVWVKMK